MRAAAVAAGPGKPNAWSGLGARPGGGGDGLGGGALLGLDLGTQTIGTAFCDAGWRFASPGKTLKRGKFGADKALLGALDAQLELSAAAIGGKDSMSGSFLDRDVPPTLISFAIAPLLEGRSAGVISEAGVPGVADPGAPVVGACHRRGIRVVPLVGPSSIILAVMASGLNGQSFAFNGYLPVKPPERAKAIRFFERRALSEGQSQLFIEAPYRNVKLMEQLLQTLAPETRLTLAMDITAPGEYIRTLPVREWRSVRLPEMNRRPAIFIIG